MTDSRTNTDNASEHDEPRAARPRARARARGCGRVMTNLDTFESPGDHVATFKTDELTARCPFDGCGWSIEVAKLYPEDQMAREDAEHQAERHFDRKHRGKARIRVVLEREVSVHPKQELSKILDRYHDKVEEDRPGDFDVAYAIGEWIEEPDRSLKSGTEGLQ